MPSCAPVSAWCAIWLSIGLAACAGQGSHAAELAPAQLAALCASCHRLDNRPHGIAPIASLGKPQIIAMMRGFKARRLPGSQMHVVCNALSDEEIVAVAGFLSETTGKPSR